ncbi:MAG TPA: M3 family metallopeptidase, partial [Methanoregulaceae archaeon]|nr:M3 family metallopeptidase [Methanoregulaceae archaeon]
TVGYLYLDLYPREGKYGHFATFPVISGRMKEGTWSVPVTAIVGNFPAPADNRPGLLTIDDVGTVFHEGGHAMHNLLTTVPYGTQSGFNTEWDFVETPSQTLEEWTYDPEVLTALSGHYANTSQKIPPDLRDRVIAARDVGAGYLYGTMLAKTLEDMEFHMADAPPDTQAAYARLYHEMTGLEQPSEVHQPASFGHLMGGYDAGYYSYLWSKVYALEITDTFKRDGMTNRTTGMRFRQEILAQGNIQDGNVLLKNFLGREPGMDAFYHRLGIEPAPGAGRSS